jgi:hypothetical protein
MVQKGTDIQRIFYRIKRGVIVGEYTVDVWKMADNGRPLAEKRRWGELYLQREWWRVYRLVAQR